MNSCSVSDVLPLSPESRPDATYSRLFSLDPFNSWISDGLFSPLFRTFLRSEIPSYYKIFLTAYLFSYTSGGAYFLVFTLAAVARLVPGISFARDDFGDGKTSINSIEFLTSFNSASVLILSILVRSTSFGSPPLYIVSRELTLRCNFVTRSTTSSDILRFCWPWFACIGTTKSCSSQSTVAVGRCTLYTR